MGISNQHEELDIFSKRSIKEIDNFQGKHILLEIYGCNSEKLNDELFLRCILNNAANNCH